VKRCENLIFSFLPAILFFICAKPPAPAINLDRTKEKAAECFKFCRQHGYDTKYCIFFDMSLPSGVKRFMVWDFRKNNIFISGLVSHGCGNGPWSGVWSKDKPSFSNSDGSHCTALGKYQVNDRAYSAWGVHVKYFLAGLDAGNNNALIRQIVFHSWEEVPEDEIYPQGTPEGWGCPAISNNTMKIVDPLIRRQKKHLLLWIYN
jgi:hypothetical protein